VSRFVLTAMVANMIRELYKIFRDYLSLLVHQSQDSFNVTFHTAIPDEPLQKITSIHLPGRDRKARELEIRVLTPAFYSRFVHYAYTSEAFDRECIFTDEKNRTLWISRPQLLPLLVDKPSEAHINQAFVAKRSYFDELRWKLLKKLRCAPASPAYAVSTPSKTEVTTEDVLCLPYSELDLFVRNSCGRARAGEYRRIVTKLFLALRFGLAFGEIIGLLDLIIRALFCCLAAFQILAWRAQSTQADVGGCSYKAPIYGNHTLCFEDVREAHAEWWSLVGAAVSISACHMYGMLKGYN